MARKLRRRSLRPDPAADERPELPAHVVEPAGKALHRARPCAAGRWLRIRPTSRLTQISKPRARESELFIESALRAIQATSIRADVSSQPKPIVPMRATKSSSFSSGYIR